MNVLRSDWLIKELDRVDKVGPEFLDSYTYNTNYSEDRPNRTDNVHSIKTAQNSLKSNK